MKAHVEAFVARQRSMARARVQIRLEPIHGGLESSVARARVAGPPTAALPERFVIKELGPAFVREADVYVHLWAQLERPPAAAILGVQAVGDRRFLYLEDVAGVSDWPWRDTASAAAVCRALARLHDNAALACSLFAWDYDAELERSAASTLELARRARDAAGRRCWRRAGDLKRVVQSLPAVRARLAASGRSVVHGDVHPGNVILRTGPPEPRVALIDWSRARVGAPLEDVASWLHSLGCWEPQARRRHDTLLRVYLESRRIIRPLTVDLRTDYWFASVSNGLSGAIRYHLAVLSDPASPAPARYDSARALIAWERVVRRAASLLRTNPPRCT